MSQSAGLIAICAVLAVANAACDPVVPLGLPLDQGNGLGGQGGDVSSSSGGQAGVGGAASSSSSGQAGAGGAGGAGGGGTSSSSSGQAGAGGAGMCLDGQTQSCYTGPIGTENLGACKSGAQTCFGGVWSTCVGDIQPAVEVCDNIDNDCNGQMDDGNPGSGLLCSTGQLGLCAPGTTACMEGSIVCNALNQPEAEFCDGLDNDCNGQADEGNPGGGSMCTTGQLGACLAGTTACAGGSIVCNALNQPIAEACDNIDNDCDGQVDDGNPGGGLTCTTGQLGACAAGKTACSFGSVVCNALNQPKSETCDNIDNDCNGQVDDGNPGGGLSCATGQFGACASGTTTCTNGAVVCNATNQPTAEVCDKIDNNCNIQVDEGNPGGGLPCATGLPGACSAGMTACTGGAVVCNATKQPTTEVCDNIDNDCDGQVDEGNPGGGLKCATGQPGVCNAGKTVCVGGAMACTMPNQPTTEVCDNIDNDCDGQVDEDNSCPPQQIVCGVFVGPPGVGAPGNPGTQTQPVSTIAVAQGLAALSGSDICLCAPVSGVTTYQEDVTMSEGISIYGGYNCADWTRDISTYITEIKGSVSFSGGITSATVLDGLSVAGKDYTVSMPQPDTSIAISISNSSPRLVNVKASGGLADYSTGLAIDPPPFL